MSYTSKHPKFDDVIFTDVGLAGSVANPAANSDKIVNRGGNFFSRSSSGAEKPLGGGGGEVNVFTDTDGIGATWVASGVGVTVANTSTSSEIALSPIKTTAIKLTNISGTDYMRGRFTMPAGLKNRKLKIEFFQEALSGYVTGDNKIEIYTNTASNYSGSYTELPLSTDVSGTSDIANATGKFTTYFDSDSSDYYEVRIVRVSGTAAITFGGIIVGPGIQPFGGIVTEWQSYTPTFVNFGTVSAFTAMYRRVGSNLELIVDFNVDTTAGAAGSISLPAGLNIDTSVILNTRQNRMGEFVNRTAGTNPTPVGALIYSAPDTDRLYFSATNSASLYSANNTNAIFTAGDSVDCTSIKIPIAEWAGNGVTQLAENAVEYSYNFDTADANDTTSFGYGPGGTFFGNYTTAPTKRVRFQSPILPTDILVLEIDKNNSGQWVPLGGDFGSFVVEREVQNVTSYGMTFAPLSGSVTDVEVFFGTYGIPNSATYGAAGEPWSSTVSTDAKWRIRKVAQNAALGFQEATSNSTGLAGPSGTWIPGDQGSINIDGLANLKGYYSKVGKIVTCTVTVDIDATAAAPASAIINVPPGASTTFTATNQAMGVGTNIFDKNVGTVSSVNGTSNVSLDFTAVVLTSTNWMWSFQYEVL